MDHTTVHQPRTRATESLMTKWEINPNAIRRACAPSSSPTTGVALHSPQARYFLMRLPEPEISSFVA